MTWLAKVTFPYFTAIPEDVVVNTWHFAEVFAGGPGEGEFADLRDRLATFYSTVYNVGYNIFCAPWVRPTLNNLKLYDLSEPSPRSPHYDAGMALTGVTPVPSTSNCTPETSICLSYQADGLSGVAQSRRRGRIFLGGLGVATDAGNATNFPVIGSAARTVVADAAEALMNGAAADGWLWVVHSGTAAGDSVVTNGWIDDEPDTQRRRGRKPLLRTTWP